MPDWMERIRSAVGNGGHDTMTWSAGDGALLVMPFAARILGCRVDGVEGNLFWHCPDAEDQARTTELLKAPAAMGGDRLWIAPEIAHHWPSLEAARGNKWMQAYCVPAIVDPGDYQIIESDDGHLRAEADMALHDHRVSKSISFRVERQFTVEPEPLPGIPTALKVVSFTIRNRLTATGGDEGAVAGAWDILQLPARGGGGTIICPTLHPIDAPHCYFEPFGDHVKTGPGVVSVRIDAQRQFKLGLPPQSCLGRMGYYRRGADGQCTLIVRIFGIVPGAPYVDTMRSCPDDQRTGGDCLQVYNDDGAYGEFGEMEYHDPGIVVGQHPTSREGTSITHVLAGPQSEVEEAAQWLLGVEI